MKWIKASERLPDEGGLYVCKIANQDYHYKKEIELFSGKWVVYDEDEYIAEWLDESEPSLDVKSMEEVLDEIANSYTMVAGMDVVIRDAALKAMQQYSNSQNKKLRDWKESAMDIMRNIDLQECGKLLKLQPGLDISKHILPALQQNKNLREALEALQKWDEEMLSWKDAHVRLQAVINNALNE